MPFLHWSQRTTVPMKIFATIDIMPEEWTKMRDAPKVFGLDALPELARIFQDEVLYSLAKEMKNKTPELLPYFIKQLEENPGACSTFMLAFLKEG